MPEGACVSLLAWAQAVPGVKWAELAVVVVVVGALGTAFTAQHVKIANLKAAVATEKQGRSDDRAAYAANAASQAAANLVETNRRLAEQAKASDASHQFELKAVADRAVRNTADDRLRGATAVVAARCGAPRSDSAASAVSPAASSPGDLLAYVQRRMGEAAGSVIDYADHLRPAAEECAARYDALGNTKVTSP